MAVSPGLGSVNTDYSHFSSAKNPDKPKERTTSASRENAPSDIVRLPDGTQLKTLNVPATHTKRKTVIPKRQKLHFRLPRTIDVLLVIALGIYQVVVLSQQQVTIKRVCIRGSYSLIWFPSFEPASSSSGQLRIERPFCNEELPQSWARRMVMVK